MKIKVNNWQSISHWTWVVQDDSCSICRQLFNACCPECKVPGDDCPPVWGQCDHHFHIHCIIKWLREDPDQRCPLCRKSWSFKTTNHPINHPIVPSS